MEAKTVAVKVGHPLIHGVPMRFKLKSVSPADADEAAANNTLLTTGELLNE